MHPSNPDHGHAFSQPPVTVPPPPQYYPLVVFPPPPPPHYHHPGACPIIPMSQPPIYSYPHQERPWSTGLLDCFSDIKNCCTTIWCPCVTFGRISEIINEGQTSSYETGMLCGLLGYVGVLAALPIFACHTSFPYTCWYRTKMRQRYKLKGSYLSDCLIHAFCEYCALCQEYHELDRQGFDVPLGWHENIERQRHAVAVYRIVPVVEQGMRR